jgi:N-methylhydantoinase B
MQGMPGYVELVRADGEVDRFYKGERVVGAGDILKVVSGGGGGYEPAFARDPAAVASDVKFGYVSRESAASDYGVVIGTDGGVDQRRTVELRARSEASVKS